MSHDNSVAGPGRRIIEHAEQLQESHLVCQAEVYQEDGQPSRADDAVEGFQGFLATFTAHVSAPKRFITDAYAAAWVIHPGAFDGMRGQDIAKLIGVPRETFSRSVAAWSAKTGIRPTTATRAFKAHRQPKEP